MLLLGHEPRDDLVVPLTAGAAYQCTLVHPTAWPAGTRIELRWPHTGLAPWVADVDGADAVLTATPAQVDAALAARPRSVQLWYLPDPDQPWAWATGKVRPS